MSADGFWISRLLDVLSQPFQPKDRRPIYEVLADDLVLGPAESPYPGAFDIDNSPQIKEPLDALAQDHVRRVSVSGAAQLAKTTLGLVFAIYCIKKRPGLTTWNGQTDDAVKKVAEDKAWPLFRRCKSLQTMMPADRHKSRIKSIVFPHMSLRFQSASENNAHSDTVKNQINDERHLWEPGIIFKFLSRVGSMPDHKVLDLSTGSVKYDQEQLPDGTVVEYGDDFFADWMGGTREIWSVCCPKCRRLQPLVWKHRDADGKDLLDEQGKPVFGIVWDENEKTRPGGRWAYGEVRETARWKCQADALGIGRADGGGTCDHEIEDHPDNIRDLNAISSGARYVVTNPLADTVHRTFRFPAMVSELVGWGTLVVEWLKALEATKAGDFGPLKTFIQNRLAEAWDASVTVATESSATADYKFGEPWIDAEGNSIPTRRFLTVDVQEKGGRHYKALCREWTKNGDSRFVSYDTLYSWEDVREKQLELNVQDNRVIVDAADGNNTNEICAACVKYGWVAFQGVDKEAFAHKRKRSRGRPVFKPWAEPIERDPALGSRDAGKRKHGVKRLGGSGKKSTATLYRWSNPTIKDVLASLIAGNSKYWGRPADEPKEYTAELNSEVKKQVKNKAGGFRFMWVRTRPDNHARDCEAMQTAAAMMSGFLVLDEPEAPEPDKDAEAAEQLRAAAQATLTPPRTQPAKVRTYTLRDDAQFSKN